MSAFRPLSRRLMRIRPYSTSMRFATPYSPGPSPPRLPKEDQEVFEQLQQQSTGAFSTPRRPETPKSSRGEASSRPQINQSPQSEPDAIDARVNASGDGEELHPDVRRGALPEFEGDQNPKTGEVGGPKNEPQRWGPNSDYSYNGRVTDF